MRLRHSRGFTLIEIVVVCGAAVLLALFCAALAKGALATFQKTGTRFRDAQTIARLSELWLAEEDNAWAIFTPPNDVSGKSNADGHEVDFFSHDETQKPEFWAYTFDASTQTLTRSTYAALAAPGAPASPVIDQTFGGITFFAAHTYALAALQDPSAPVYSPAYASAVLKNASVEFFSASAPWVAGGNQITHLVVQTAMRTREFHLSTQSAPSGYVVVLNYTPAPSSSSSPTPGLSVWPPAIRFAAQGSGGLAGSSSCVAQAFTDTTFATPIADGTSDPFGAGVTVNGPDGCYSGAVAVHETGFAGAFADYVFPSTACSNTQVLSGNWLPSRYGPTASQAFAGGSDTTTGCALGFSDTRAMPKTGQATAQVVQPCWAVGGSCTYAMSYQPDQSPGCDPVTGATQMGYTGQGHATITPGSAGTWSTSDGGADYAFTRTSAGSVTVDVFSQYQKWTATLQSSGLYRCTSATTLPLTSTFTIPSV